MRAVSKVEALGMSFIQSIEKLEIVVNNGEMKDGFVALRSKSIADQLGVSVQKLEDRFSVFRDDSIPVLDESRMSLVDAGLELSFLQSTGFILED